MNARGITATDMVSPHSELFGCTHARLHDARVATRRRLSDLAVGCGG